MTAVWATLHTLHFSGQTGQTLTRCILAEVVAGGMHAFPRPRPHRGYACTTSCTTRAIPCVMYVCSFRSCSAHPSVCTTTSVERTTTSVEHPTTPYTHKHTAPPSPCRHLWLGNIPLKPNRAALELVFAQYGPVESVRVFPGKTFAFVNFTTQQHALDAKAALDGRPCGAITGVKPLVVRFQKDPAAVPQSARASTDSLGKQLRQEARGGWLMGG